MFSSSVGTGVAVRSSKPCKCEFYYAQWVDLFFHFFAKGLAAIQTAKNMGAIVRAFDVRPVTKEQVEAMGGHFLEVDFKEDGSGTGGYAKEMSKEWHAAAAKMLSKQCEEVDIIITTAQIPGRKAPIMITKVSLGFLPYFLETISWSQVMFVRIMGYSYNRIWLPR